MVFNSYGHATIVEWSPPRGLSDAWYDFEKIREIQKLYNHLYFISRISPTTLESLHYIERCGEQEKFDSCDLKWCVAYSRRTGSKREFEIAEKALNEHCFYPQINYEFEKQFDLIKKHNDR